MKFQRLCVKQLPKQAQLRQDSIESFEKGGRAELVEKEKEELAILNEYLPQPLSADEISTVVRETIAEAGATSPGFDRELRERRSRRAGRKGERGTGDLKRI